jgi:hypothetical protein
MMTATRWLLLAVLPLFLFATSAQAATVKLSEGTEVRLRMLEGLSSATAMQGQRFNMELDDDVRVDGVVVIPRGAKALGTVVSARKRGFMGKAGELNIMVDYLLVNDERVRLRASSGREGDGRVGATVALTVLFGPLGLLKRGKDIEVNPGVVIPAYIDQTTEIAVR